jgi:hypothetical protein
MKKKMKEKKKREQDNVKIDSKEVLYLTSIKANKIHYCEKYWEKKRLEENVLSEMAINRKKTKKQKEKKKEK